MMNKAKLSALPSKSRTLALTNLNAEKSGTVQALRETFPQLSDHESPRPQRRTFISQTPPIHTLTTDAHHIDEQSSIWNDSNSRCSIPIPIVSKSADSTTLHPIVQVSSIVPIEGIISASTEIPFERLSLSMRSKSQLEKIEENRKLSRLPRRGTAKEQQTSSSSRSKKIRRKSSHEMSFNPKAAAVTKKESSEPIAAVHEVIVEDDVKAQEIDKLIQGRLNEARALSRKIDSNGANMHTFALWSRRAPVVEEPMHGAADDDCDGLAPSKISRMAVVSSVSHPTPMRGTSQYSHPSDYFGENLPEDQEEQDRDRNSYLKLGTSRPGGLANMLRQAVVNASTVSDTDSLGSRNIRGGHSTEAADEVEDQDLDLFSRHNDLDSIHSIEEDEDLDLCTGLGPVRRRSYSEGELGHFVRHFSSDDIANYNTRMRSPSPDLSEVSRESYPSSQSQQAVSASASREAEVKAIIDFTDSTMKWKQGEFLGEGSFGKVYKGLNESTGELIAVKQLFLANGSSEEVAQLRKEISVMWDLNHANIVRYLGTARSDRWLFILLEYVPGGSIANMLHQFGAFTESLLKRFTAQIVCGTTYLHSKGIIHRDIKGANVLVGVDGIAKLSDFGCSKKVYGVCTTSIEESMKVMQGSVPWMAPEVVKQTGSGFASDIWSIGATIIEMATGKPPWTELFTSNLAAMFHVATLVEPPPFPANLSDDCAAFLRKCLVIDPKYRTPAADLTLDHYIALQS